MNRLAILTSILLLVVFLGLNVTSAQEKRGKTLHDAVIGGDVNEVKSLLSNGADINQKNRMGGTPLHTAITNRQKAIAEMLIARGADVNAKDNSGQTPLSEAVKAGDKDLVELLIAKKADVNAITGLGENALSIAKKTGRTEIAELLVKNGAKEPSLQDLEGDMYPRGAGAGYPAPQNPVQPQSPVGTVGQPAGQLDVLTDPNEIKARVKTFAGLEKALKEVSDKSQNEARQWEQKRYDNRTYLARAVQLQFEDEMALMRNVAVEEKAKKTTESIDALLSSRNKRSDAVYRALMEQKREQKQTQPTQSARGRTRGRTTGRNVTGRDLQAGPYGAETAGTPYEGQNAAPGRNRPEDQLDRETQDEIRQWMQVSTDRKDELAKTVHQQIMAEMSSVRAVAVEEKAKKTTAAIDGILLARQERFNEFVRKMQEQEQKAQQAQDPRTLERSAGRYAPGAGTQPQQQQNQRRTRGRRR
jgi:hypothetical protein